MKKDNSKNKIEKSSKVKKNKKENIFTRFKKYLKEVGQEMKKTKWPSRKDMISYSIATLSFILVFALFFAFGDVIIAFVKQVLR